MKCWDSHLKAKDLCLIMKACKESGVAKLSLGEISLEFFKPDSYNPLELPNTGPSINNFESSDHLSIDPTQIIVRPQDQVLIEDEVRSQLLIDDPQAFEERMISEDMAMVHREVNDNGPEDTRSGENI